MQVLVVMVEQEQILAQVFQLPQILEYMEAAVVVAQVQDQRVLVELEVVELEALWLVELQLRDQLTLAAVVVAVVVINYLLEELVDQV